MNSEQEVRQEFKQYIMSLIIGRDDANSLLNEKTKPN